MNKTMTNLDRLRAVTEHVRCYPDLADSLSSVHPLDYLRVMLYADTMEDDVHAFTRWAESIDAARASVTVSQSGHFHFNAEGRLAGGADVTVATVVLDPAPLAAYGITPGDAVPVAQLAALIEGARV